MISIPHIRPPIIIPQQPFNWSFGFKHYLLFSDPRPPCPHINLPYNYTLFPVFNYVTIAILVSQKINMKLDLNKIMAI